MLDGGTVFQTNATKGYGMALNTTKGTHPNDDDSLASLVDIIIHFIKWH